MKRQPLPHFNDKPKSLGSMSGTPVDEKGRNRSVRAAWKDVNEDLISHKNQGIEIEPIRRAKIADRLKRDHHRAERTSGRTRGIIKGRVG